MNLRIEPFINGFMTGLKPQMSAVDHELFELIFKAHVRSRFAIREEENSAKPAHYFRLGAAHLNVILPVWLLNRGSSARADRFRVACTEDHSFILDTRDKILYDPTTEILHKAIEHRAFWLDADWREESRLRYADELKLGQLKVFCLTDRIEQIPALYTEFVLFVARRRLKAKVPQLRYGLTIEASGSIDALIEMAMDELISRNSAA